MNTPTVYIETPLSAAAVMMLANMTRAQEVAGYAAGRKITLANAIVELVNAGLSDQADEDEPAADDPRRRP